jgi:hypothetical protein
VKFQGYYLCCITGNDVSRASMGIINATVVSKVIVPTM